MAMNWTEAQINDVVASVLRQMKLDVSAPTPAFSYSATAYEGRTFVGVFEDMKDAIAAAEAGYAAVRAMSVAQREVLISAIRKKPEKKPKSWQGSVWQKQKWAE